jgi:hypothetical protein
VMNYSINKKKRKDFNMLRSRNKSVNSKVDMIRLLYF